jgi:transposase
MAGAKRRRYTPEFKRDAVRLASDPTKSVAQVARELGIGKESLHAWIKQHASPSASPAARDSDVPVMDPVAQAEEIRRLRRELAVVTEEREILKKATAFFAKEST